MTINTSWCPHHRGKSNEHKRDQIRAKIELLPKYEGSNWCRHKCPFCAYEEGYKEGIEAGKRLAAKRLEKLITD